MANVRDIEFSEDSALLVQKLIDGVKTAVVCDVYPLVKLDQLRMAHHGPNGQKRARGVFAKIHPTRDGATVVRGGRGHSGSDRRTRLTEASLGFVQEMITLWASQNRDTDKGIERVEPDQPGTVQGGRFESNRKRF